MNGKMLKDYSNSFEFLGMKYCKKQRFGSVWIVMDFGVGMTKWNVNLKKMIVNFRLGGNKRGRNNNKLGEFQY